MKWFYICLSKNCRDYLTQSHVNICLGCGKTRKAKSL